jgi:hypothetical protein
MSDILLRNAGYEPLRIVSTRKAYQMVLKGKAFGLVYSEDCPMYGGLPVPDEIILKDYVQMKWLGGLPKYSKKRLFARDKHKCAYCGGYANTKDHVKPKSKGGEDSWENLVSACFPCNSKKGNRTLAESGMKLRYQPHQPTWAEVIC